MTIPAAKGKNASYEARQKQAQDWPLVLASVNLTMDGETVSAARVVIYGVAPDPLAEHGGREGDHRQAGDASRPPPPPARPPSKGPRPLSMNAYKVPLTRTVVKRALLGRRRQPLLGGGLIA